MKTSKRLIENFEYKGNLAKIFFEDDGWSYMIGRGGRIVLESKILKCTSTKDHFYWNEESVLVNIYKQYFKDKVNERKD